MSTRNAVKKSSDSSLIRATYRVQLHPGFGFDRVAQIADYMAELGVSHLYPSPYLQAAKGSQHGYDIVDYGTVNAELGGREAHQRMCDALAQNGLGQVLDIVPNHMATAGPRNPWWWDVLQHGPHSRYACYFDIYWGDPPSRILVPVLGEPYGQVLERGEIKLVRQGSSIVVRYFDHVLPLSPESAAQLQAQYERDLDEHLAELNAEPARLDQVLEQQHYRLSYWRCAADELNYRCFFDINRLVGMRQEDELVFDATHTLILEWVADGTIDGLRIDHIDGLRDPQGYLDRLHARAPSTWIVVEKILESGETLPSSWPVAGTTGYEFLNLVGSVFVDPSGEQAMTDVYTSFAKKKASFADIVYEKKLYILNDKFGSEIARLTELLAKSCVNEWRFRDTRREQLRELLNEVVACFPVYRTYARVDPPNPDSELSEQDTRWVETAFARLAERRPDID